MRISDWSSDVCSSDLALVEVLNRSFTRLQMALGSRPLIFRQEIQGTGDASFHLGLFGSGPPGLKIDPVRAGEYPAHRDCGYCRRSEEYTYELQSLMRISYDVFCLKTNI